MTTELQDAPTEQAQETETLIEEPKDEKDARRLNQKKPPKDGLCRRCGETKPINRLMLCYPCWVKTNLEKFGWKDGTPHPDWCACEVEGGHQRSSGN